MWLVQNTTPIRQLRCTTVTFWWLWWSRKRRPYGNLWLWTIFKLMVKNWPHDTNVFENPAPEHGSHPSLTTRDRELVSVLEVWIEPGDLNPRPLTPQSVTLPTLPRAGESQCILFNVQEEGAKFLYGKILENIDAGRHYDCIFFWHACNCGFLSVTVFGFGYFAVKFPIIYFVVIIRIIRNVIVRWICSGTRNYYSKTIST